MEVCEKLAVPFCSLKNLRAGWQDAQLSNVDKKSGLSHSGQCIRDQSQLFANIMPIKGAASFKKVFIQQAFKMRADSYRLQQECFNKAVLRVVVCHLNMLITYGSWYESTSRVVMWLHCAGELKSPVPFLCADEELRSGY